MANKRFQLDPQTLTLLQVIESTEDEDKRQRAITDLAMRGGMNAARILIETFERSMWRNTKFSIIQALGKVRHERSIEFLCHIAGDSGDFGLAAEAVLALGTSDDPVAGEFLSSILRAPNHPLMREALTAVAHLNFFPCEMEISKILNGKESDYPAAVRQNTIIAAGLRGYRRFRPGITDIIRSGVSGPLFNTALMALGRIGDKESLDFLEKLDTRYRSFAHQLKLGAIEHLRLACSYTIEDAVSAALQAKSPVAMRQAWIILGGFPESQAREATQLLAAEGSVVFQAMERITFFQQSELENDFQFLAGCSDSIPPEIFGALARKHVQIASRDQVLRIAGKISENFLIKFLSLVRVEKGWEILLDTLSGKNLSPSNKRAALNALVIQVLMNGRDEQITETIGKKFVRLIEAENDHDLHNRMVRALGQMRYMGPDAVAMLREKLKTGNSVDGVYSALARGNSEEAAKVITKRLRQVASNAGNDAEVRTAIHSLARSEVFGDVSFLAQIPEKTLSDMRVAVIKILSQATVPELTGLVERCLKDGDFQTKILAVAASKNHQSSEIVSLLFEYLDHPNYSIAGRALDSLTTSFGSAEHYRLFKRMVERPSDEDLYKKVFKSLSPRKGDSYADVIGCLDVLIRERKEVMADQDMVQSALNTRDNLVLLSAMSEPAANASQKLKLSEADKHAIDGILSGSLRGFERFSPTIKSVLRSGEVTWQHPELFDARVDKSTVLVQYVKAVDLLLQEKIGSQMFLAQGANFLQKMQSRVIRLELDEESGLDSQLVNSLDCAMYFSRDSFPSHKLMTICRSVMTGQIMKEQYRVVDGLRAWAVLLLIFGRAFKYRGQSLEPLFPMVKSNNDSICRIARAMNDLQDARNRAAHRGTVLEKENIKELRGLSSALLNDLDSHLESGR